MKQIISQLFIALVLTFTVNAQVVINEIIPPNMVELKNLGGTEVPAGSYWLCDFPDYDQLSALGTDCGNLTIPAGGIVKVTTSSINLNATDGELGLYTINNFGSSAAIIDYVEWGSTGHTRSSVAVNAGIWTTGDFVPAWPSCSSLEYDGGGETATDWMTQDTPSSPCMENTLDGCSVAACDITATGLANISCDDDGTEEDPADDFMTFDLDPSGSNLSSGYVVTVSQGEIFPDEGIYGAPTSFELEAGTAGAGDIMVTITDAGDNGCAISAQIVDPGACSNQCSLEDLGLVEVHCDDNNTEFDPDDDRIVFDLNPTGFNLGATYNVSISAGTILPGSGTYGVQTTFDLNDGSAGNGDVTVEITDSNDPDCTLDEIIIDPDVCSACNVNGGTIMTSDITTICLTDSISDMVDVTISDADGTNSQWIIADANGIILTLPTSPPFDFTNAGEGICTIWHVSYDGPITGLIAGQNVNNLGGCHDLSNSIEIDRKEPLGGAISTTDPTDVCVGDGIQDLVDVNVAGASGALSSWVITDTNGVILSLPATPPFDFEPAGVGICDIWHLSHEPGLMGLTMGNNIANIAGCYDFSNSIRITRFIPNGGVIMTSDPTQVCADDGVPDTLDVSVMGNNGPMNSWIITSDDSTILSLSSSPPFSFEGAGAGVCKIWHLSFDGAVSGLEEGNHLDVLAGCFGLSNPINVVRDTGLNCSPCVVDGGVITTASPTTVCVGDGVADVVEVTVAGNSGPQNGWIITDSTGVILALPASPPFDFETSGAGLCLIRHISYDGVLTGLDPGNNVGNLTGCFSLSDMILITRNAVPTAGTIATEDTTTFCIDDVIDDLVDVTLSGNSGINNAWVIADTSGLILALPTLPPFNFSGSGAGICEIWHLTYEDVLTGLIVGNNISQIMGCFGLSNSIEVTRLAGDDCQSTCDVDGGVIGTTSETEICVGDGVTDSVIITRTDNTGELSTYVITDEFGTILQTVPSTTEKFTFEGAGAGTCIIYHLSYEAGLIGLEPDLSIDSLSGCFDLSNSIMVVRREGSDCTTATRNVQLSDLIDVYPNPTSGVINIDFGDLAVSHVRLINSTGKTVIEIQNPNQHAFFNTNMVPGLYLITVHTNKGVAIKKVIYQ